MSASPINLYERITAYLRLNSIPLGPLLLKKFGADPISAKSDYKLNRITTLLQAFPALEFVLIGDSGERDPEIYRSVAERFPGRVRGIVIRRVPGDSSPPERLSGMRVVDDYSKDPNVIASLVSSTGPK